jgi:Lrp/AsnC family transcriptional regulator, leucine-responsive regulatory protein
MVGEGVIHVSSFVARAVRPAAFFLKKMRLSRIILFMLAPKPTRSKTVADSTELASLTMLDALDRKILARYQSDTRVPALVIGDEVGLSAAAVQRRIKRMREIGVITNEIAQIDPNAVGLPVTVVVHVDIERETLQYIDAFKAAMRARAEVQQCWYTTGLTDFILIVRVASMAAYEQFTRDALLSNDNVAKFTSYMVLTEVKSGLSLNLDF